MGKNQRAQVRMTPDEAFAFLVANRTMAVATFGPGGATHLVAMWYAIVDGSVCLETKSRSQKVRNVRRDPRISCLVEAGDVYEQLRGVSLQGRAEVVDDLDFLWRVGVSVWERYRGQYDAAAKESVRRMMHNRVVIRVNVENVRSWDHRKLGLPSSGAPAGSTCQQARSSQH